LELEMKINLKIRKIKNNNDSQLIALMGVMLVISVFAISSIAADLANLDIQLTGEKSISLLDEYLIIKDSFGKSLNYNLSEKIEEIDNEEKLYGNMENLTDCFQNTLDEFYEMELQHDILFDAVLNDYYVAHPGSSDGVYILNVTLNLENKNTRYIENVKYSIMCLSLSS
jgi:hypothetical protein